MRSTTPTIAILGAGVAGLWAAIERDVEAIAWSAGCHRSYKSQAGKVTNNGSGFTVEYSGRMRRRDLSGFHQVARG